MSGSVNDGDQVEVTGMNGRRKYTGEVERTVDGKVWVIPEGKAKARPVDAARVRPLDRRPAPALARRDAIAPPAPVVRSTVTAPPLAPPIPKPTAPARSSSYLDFVRSYPCCYCRGKERRAGGATSRIEAHHWQSRRGVGQKVSDYRTVPLCLACHAEFHRTGALGALDARTTRELFLEAQVTCLEAWTLRDRRAS